MGVVVGVKNGMGKMENVTIKTLSNSFAKKRSRKMLQYYSSILVFSFFLFLKMGEMTECVYIYGND